MLKISEVLKSASTKDLRELIPLNSHGLFTATGVPLNRERLVDLLIDVFGEQLIVETKKSRDLVLLSLTKQQAIDALNAFNINPTENPWEKLTSIPYTGKTSETFNTIFGIEITPTSEARVRLKLNPEIIEPTYALYPHQVVAAKKVKDYLTSSKRRVLLHMPTGSGKTRTAMNVVSDLLRNALKNGLVVWLAHSEELCEQAGEEFAKAWGNLGQHPIKLHRRYGKYSESLSDIDEGMVVISLPMLHSRSQNEANEFFKFADKVNLVIFDEAHMALAETFAQVTEIMLTSERVGLLGLTATPGRTSSQSDENYKLADFFQRQKVQLEIEDYATPVDYLQAEGYLAKTIFTQLPSPASEFTLTPSEIEKIRNGWEIPEGVLKRLSADVRRNLLILKTVSEAAEAGKKIIIFGCSVDHAELLHLFLRYEGINSGLVTSRTSSEERRRTIDLYKDSDEISVLVNYGVLTTGFDAPKTNVAVIARPTTSVSLYGQMIGRAARGPKAGGNETCEIFTVVDQAIPGFANLASTFTHWEDVWTD